MAERTIVVEGRRVRIVEERPAEEADDPLLMVHGLGGWAENWSEIAPAVAARGRRAIAFDLPGFGASERARGAKYFDPDEPFYASFIHALLDGLGIERAHLAGHSLGGAIAYTAAVWRPERVRSLTLVAPGGLAKSLILELRVLTLPGMELLTRFRRSPALTRRVLYSCFHDPRRCPDEVLAQALRYGPAAAPEMVRALRGAVSFFRGVRDEVRLPWVARAERYQGPSLVIWGREDAIIPASAAEEARRIMPRAEIREIGSCGHLVMIERPHEMLDVLLPFLAGERNGSFTAVR